MKQNMPTRHKKNKIIQSIFLVLNLNKIAFLSI